jgi:hypothetical protein
MWCRAALGAAAERVPAGDGRLAERGSALVVVLMAVLLVSALSSALVLLATGETLAAVNERTARATLYAAESGVELAMPDLMCLADWDAVLAGAQKSAWVDGPPAGSRVLDDGRTIELDRIINLSNCGLPEGCSEASLDAVTERRPWGPNNPRWKLFAHGRIDVGAYVVVLVADDPSENDGDPARDGRPPGNPGAGVISLRGEGFGPAGAHRIVEATVARPPGRAAAGPGAAALRVLSWQEVR